MDPTGALIQIVDARLAEAASRSGAWLVCHPGCCSCCLGPFPISEADAARLREGMSQLTVSAPGIVAEIRRRAGAWTGGDEEPCPALNSETGTCELYAFRPLTCRTFGPPVRCASGDLAICELCFNGATEEEIEACVVDLDPELLAEAGEDEGEMTVASVLTLQGR